LPDLQHLQRGHGRKRRSNLPQLALQALAAGGDRRLGPRQVALEQGDARSVKGAGNRRVGIVI
jgi:hypothetical protein